MRLSNVLKALALQLIIWLGCTGLTLATVYGVHGESVVWEMLPTSQQLLVICCLTFVPFGITMLIIELVTKRGE